MKTGGDARGKFLKWPQKDTWVIQRWAWYYDFYSLKIRTIGQFYHCTIFFRVHSCVRVFFTFARILFWHFGFARIFFIFFDFKVVLEFLGGLLPSPPQISKGPPLNDTNRNDPKTFLTPWTVEFSILPLKGTTSIPPSKHKWVPREFFNNTEILLLLLQYCCCYHYYYLYYQSRFHIPWKK